MIINFGINSNKLIKSSTAIITMDNAAFENYDPSESVYCGKQNRTDYFGTTTTAIIGSWLSIVIVAATIGNLLVIYVIMTNRSMRDLNRGTNMFLLSLAVVDLLVGILMSPIALYTTIKECWNLGKLMCKLNNFLNSALLVTSIHTLMYISIFRCLCIHRVANNNFCPIRKWVWRTMIVCAWVWGLLFAFLTTSVLGESSYKPKTMQCGPKYPANKTSKMYILHTTNQVMTLVIPFGIMVFCYTKIYKDVRKCETFRRQQNMEVKSVIKTLLAILVLFLLCWMPYCFYTNYATLIDDKREIPFYINPIAYCCGYMNSACNPIIYAWRFPEFRQGYRDILCKRPSYVVNIGPDGERRFRSLPKQSKRLPVQSNSFHNASAQRRSQMISGSGCSVTNDKSNDRQNGVPENHGSAEDEVLHIQDKNVTTLES